jgi:hypothetical protein
MLPIIRQQRVRATSCFSCDLFLSLNLLSSFESANSSLVLITDNENQVLPAVARIDNGQFVLTREHNVIHVARDECVCSLVRTLGI